MATTATRQVSRLFGNLERGGKRIRIPLFINGLMAKARHLYYVKALSLRYRYAGPVDVADKATGQREGSGGSEFR